MSSGKASHGLTKKMGCGIVPQAGLLVVVRQLWLFLASWWARVKKMAGKSTSSESS